MKYSPNPKPNLSAGWGQEPNHMIAMVLPPQESMDNGPSLFDYKLEDPYNDIIDDFDPYLEYGKGYRNWTVFEDVFYG